MLSDPTDLLKIYLQEEISVRLRSGEQYDGVLKGYDEHMNVLLGAEKESIFIRGEQVFYFGQREFTRDTLKKVGF